MDGRPEVDLLASPLLGPTVWTPVRDELRAQGWGCRVLDDVRNPPSLARGAILVAHSNAGAYVPELAINCRASMLVFVDAILPLPAGTTSLAPPAAMEKLKSLADDDGLLPPWTKWWDEADVAALFPSDESRRLVEAAEPRLSLAYFDKTLDAPVGWDARRAAYLSFGNAYAAQRQDASNRGWPTHILDGRHLHMLVDPPAVATALLDLIGTLTG